MQDDGVIMPRADEAWRKLKTPREQRFGVLKAAQPGCDLRQPADCRDVGGTALQVRPQQRFGLRDLIRDECGRGGEQLRVVCRSLNMPGVRVIRPGSIAETRQLVRKSEPALRNIRLESYGVAQCRNRSLRLPSVGER